jgi:hypothetical protein
MSPVTVTGRVLTGGRVTPPVLTSPNQLSTLQKQFAFARLSRPCLPGSLSRRFRDAHHHVFWPQQLAVAWDQRPDHRPEGPSFISRTVCTAVWTDDARDTQPKANLPARRSQFVLMRVAVFADDTLGKQNIPSS